MGSARPRVPDPITATFLKKEFPLLAGKLENVTDLDIGLFGTSVVGGDLENDKAFVSEYQSGDISDFGTQSSSSRTELSLRDEISPFRWLGSLATRR